MNMFERIEQFADKVSKLFGKSVLVKACVLLVCILLLGGVLVLRAFVNKGK